MNEVNNEMKSVFALLHEAFLAVQNLSNAAKSVLRKGKFIASDKGRKQ